MRGEILISLQSNLLVYLLFFFYFCTVYNDISIHCYIHSIINTVHISYYVSNRMSLIDIIRFSVM